MKRFPISFERELRGIEDEEVEGYNVIVGSEKARRNTNTLPEFEAVKTIAVLIGTLVLTMLLARAAVQINMELDSCLGT